MLTIKGEPRLADEAKQEHDEAKTLISQIESGIGRGDEIAGLVAQLREDVQHHVQEEEAEIFPWMRKEIPDIVASMGSDVAQRKEMLQEKMRHVLETSQPPSTLGNKATGHLSDGRSSGVRRRRVRATLATAG